jgi:hypothetical protein
MAGKSVLKGGRVRSISACTTIRVIVATYPDPAAGNRVSGSATRALPVVDGDRPVGIGDLAIERDETSALADINVAESNR